MTYKIDYETKEGKWESVFDIEFSLTYSESNRTKKEWYFISSLIIRNIPEIVFNLDK